MLFGLFHLPWWGYLIVAFVMTQITIAAVTIYLHRCQAHRSLELNPIISHFFRLWLWLSTGMSTKAWVAIHRKHHVFVDQQEDPHSPKIYGIRKVLFEGAELYKKEANVEETLVRYGKGTPDDWAEENIYKRFHMMGIFLMLAIDLVCFGLAGIPIWGVQMIWIPFWAAGVVNGIGHFWGYRNFSSPDMSRNLTPWAFIIGGEELHNNHHTFPNSAKFSVKWWEFDLGWLYISLLRRVKLAKVERFTLPAPIQKVANRAAIDDETLLVLTHHRFDIFSRYTRDVILPTFRDEKRRAGEVSRAWFKKAKCLVKWDSRWIDDSGRHRLSVLLEKCQSLNLVYQLREQLQQICQNTAFSQSEMLEALKDWCKRAEESGIQALQDFVARLKSYSLREAPAA